MDQNSIESVCCKLYTKEKNYCGQTMAIIDHKINQLLLQKVKVFCQSGTERTKCCALFFWLFYLGGKETERERENARQWKQLLPLCHVKVLVLGEMSSCCGNIRPVCCHTVCFGVAEIREFTVKAHVLYNLHTGNGMTLNILTLYCFN